MFGQELLALAKVIASLEGAIAYQVERIPPFEARTVDDHLCAVARQFIEAQEAREDAGYDVASEWSSAAVREHIEHIEDAIRSWEVIRDEPAARQFLVQLFGPHQRRR